MGRNREKQICLHQQVSRQLEVLANRNNSTAIVSARAEKIIDNLILGLPFSSSGHHKPKTDKRLRNSMKFDLGRGYRLICIRKKDAIHVMFLGNHDNCDKWLTQHGRKKPYRQGHDVFVDRICGPLPDGGDKELLEEEICFPEIPQKYLRQVFKGLIG